MRKKPKHNPTPDPDWLENDRAWFKARPKMKYRLRPYAEGEFDLAVERMDVQKSTITPSKAVMAAAVQAARIEFEKQEAAAKGMALFTLVEQVKRGVRRKQVFCMPHGAAQLPLAQDDLRSLAEDGWLPLSSYMQGRL